VEETGTGIGFALGKQLLAQLINPCSAIFAWSDLRNAKAVTKANNTGSLRRSLFSLFRAFAGFPYNQ
jgi:hypothetical protein